MAMIKGITVLLHERKQTRRDEFNHPTFEDTLVEVENVLVAPSTSDDIISTMELYGKRAVFQLAIPKGDQHNWNDTIVEFYGQKWRTFGFAVEGIEGNIPLEWNKRVMVECYG